MKALRRALGLVLFLLEVPVLSFAGALDQKPPNLVIDGDPREAFLQGAQQVRMYDAVTGFGDGSLRAYSLVAIPEGLYVALLSTEEAQTVLTLPERGAQGADLLLG